LKKQQPQWEIHYLTKKAYRSVLEANPYIDHLHILEESLDSMIEDLLQLKFDLVIDLHHNLRTLKVKRGLKAKSYSFNKLNIEKWLMTALKIDRLPSSHIVDRYMQTLDELGIENDGKGLDYFISEKDKVDESDIPASHLAGYIGVVIGAAHATKKMPEQKLKELCDNIHHPIILLGGPEDKKAGDIIAQADPIKIYNACGKFSLNESADLVRRARLIVTHDTGLMHIAAAYQKPIISLWGNTIPKFGMTPYYGKWSHQYHDVFEIPQLQCRPCSKIGYDKCPKGHFKCMNLINIQDVVKRVEERLGRGNE
jgi:ADP-heptose:LPS heptosyltransferase